MKSRWLQYIEAVTGLSVIITLVVMIFEVRGNTLALERQLLVDRTANVAAPFLSSSDNLLEAFQRIKDVDGWSPSMDTLVQHYGLEPQQAVAWSMLLCANWSGLETDFITVGPSDGLRDQIRGLLSFPDNQIFWETEADGFDLSSFRMSSS